jgi:hypothetical protein
MYPHRIRLHGPWECEPLARSPDAPEAVPLPAACQVTIPCRWSDSGVGDFRGRVRFRRRFGQPRHLDAQERAWLTFAAFEGAADIWLNGSYLGHCPAGSAFEFNVTAHLRERNELAVEVESNGAPGGISGEVALEIRCAEYLRSVRFWTTRSKNGWHVHAAGEVVGESACSLELYLIGDRFTAAYRRIVAMASGTSFHVVSDEELSGCASACVELVNGGEVLYSVRQALSEQT